MRLSTTFLAAVHSKPCLLFRREIVSFTILVGKQPSSSMFLIPYREMHSSLKGLEDPQTREVSRGQSCLSLYINMHNTLWTISRCPLIVIATCTPPTKSFHPPYSDALSAIKMVKNRTLHKERWGLECDYLAERWSVDDFYSQIYIPEAPTILWFFICFTVSIPFQLPSLLFSLEWSSRLFIAS